MCIHSSGGWWADKIFITKIKYIFISSYAWHISPLQQHYLFQRQQQQNGRHVEKDEDEERRWSTVVHGHTIKYLLLLLLRSLFNERQNDERTRLKVLWLTISNSATSHIKWTITLRHLANLNLRTQNRNQLHCQHFLILNYKLTWSSLLLWHYLYKWGMLLKKKKDAVEENDGRRGRKKNLPEIPDQEHSSRARHFEFQF